VKLRMQAAFKRSVASIYSLNVKLKSSLYLAMCVSPVHLYSARALYIVFIFVKLPRILHSLHFNTFSLTSHLTTSRICWIYSFWRNRFKGVLCNILLPLEGIDVDLVVSGRDAILDSITDYQGFL